MAKVRRKRPRSLGSQNKRKTFGVTSQQKINKKSKSARQRRFAMLAANDVRSGKIPRTVRGKPNPMVPIFLREGSVTRKGSATSNRAFNAKHPRRKDGKFRKKG